MSDEPSQIPADAPVAETRVDAPPPAADPAPPAPDFAAEHPEAIVAGAFAGAFLFAKLLRRVSRV